VIIKYFELKKISLKEYNYFLFYGENEGLKSELIKNNFEINFRDKIYRYDEKEILNNKENFFNTILTRSFFEDKKLIIIERATDKTKDILEEIIEKEISDLIVVLNSGVLEKKSKLRTLFEKNKQTICVPIYEDNSQTLNSIINEFFRNKKIPVSQQLINILIERSRGDRKNLNNELEKIESFSLNKKNINIQQIIKLTNLADNYGASELIDNCLAKNTRKTVSILNENNYSDDDNIIIIRTLLSKLKRLSKIYEFIDEKKNIEGAISLFKPPIFWKDKPLVIQQINAWSKKELKNLVYKTNEVELLIKKNSAVSKNILFDFIIDNSKKINS
tara:strand:- start:389 stop:1384 length:996 start_codon:yes stop_codon:yes gene_type:complete